MSILVVSEVTGTEEPLRAPLDPAVGSSRNVWCIVTVQSDRNKPGSLGSFTHACDRFRARIQILPLLTNFKLNFSFSSHLSHASLTLPWACGGFTSMFSTLIQSGAQTLLLIGRLTPSGTAMTQAAQNPPIVPMKNAPFLAFSGRRGWLCHE